MDYRSKNRLHQMRTGKTPVKGAPRKNPATPVASGPKVGPTRNPVAASNVPTPSPEVLAAKAAKADKRLAPKPSAIGRAAAAAQGMAGTMADAQANAGAEQAALTQAADRMSATRIGMQRSTPGRAQEIINKRRI